MDKVKAVEIVLSTDTEEIIEESKFLVKFEDFHKDFMMKAKTFVSKKVKLLFIDAEWWITIRSDPGIDNYLIFKVHISRSAGQVQLENCGFSFATSTSESKTASGWFNMSNDKTEYETNETFYGTNQDTINDISIDIVLTIKRLDDPLIKSKFSNPVKGYYDIIDNISKLMLDSTFADFTFVVRGKEFKVHKNILAASSSVFAGLFTSDMQEARENVCIVDNFEPETFDHVLQFIYRAKLPTNFSLIAQEIYEAADYYDLQLLKEFCANEILSQLSKDNAVELYCWAYVFDSLEELKKDSWDMIKRDILHIYFRMKDEPWPPEDLKTLIELKHRYQQSMENIKEDSEPEEKK